MTRPLPLLLALCVLACGGCSSSLPLSEAVPFEFQDWGKAQGIKEIRFLRAHGDRVILAETAMVAESEIPQRTSLEVEVVRKSETSVELTLSLTGWRPMLRAKELHYRIFRDPEGDGWNWNDQRRTEPAASGTLAPDDAGDFSVTLTLPCQPADTLLSFTASTLCTVRDARVFFLPGLLSADSP